MPEQQFETVSKYDRLRGQFADIATFTRPSTITNMQTLTGKAETFIIETCRHSDLGDYIFVQCVDETQNAIRLCLPPKVADVIASQRESLTTKRRSLAAKRRAAELTEDQKDALRERLKKARKERKRKK